MGEKRSKVTAPSEPLIDKAGPSQPQSKTWCLSDPGMDLLERAGLAGLYMALQAARAAGQDLSPLEWDDADLTSDSVTVRWAGPARPAFTNLMKWAWQVRDGVFYFPAVHDNRARTHWWERVMMHNGLIGTCFQNSQVQPRGAAISRIVRIEDDVELNYNYLSVICPKPHSDIRSLFDKADAMTNDVVKMSSWVMPGNTNRYPSDGANWKATPWRGPPWRALLLMLTSTVNIFLKLPRNEVKIKNAKKLRANWAVIEVRP